MGGVWRWPVGAGAGTVQFADLPARLAGSGAALAALGIRADQVVAYVAHHPFAGATLFLALSAHATAAPIPAHVTGAEFRALLSLLNPAAVVFGDAAAPLVAEAAQAGLPVLAAREEAPGQFAFDALNDAPIPATPRQNPGKGVILTTSGTTGTPKLVALSADRLLAGAGNVAGTLGLRAEDTCVEIMPLHHIHGLVAGLLAPLVSGATNTIRPDRDAQGVLTTARDTGATWYTAVPTMHRAILDAGRADPALAGGCRFRLIRSSSSSMPADVRAGLQDLFACPVVEAYGMTEATHQISSQAPTDDCRHGNIGTPRPGSLRVADGSGAPLPDGREGRGAAERPDHHLGLSGQPRGQRPRLRERLDAHR